MKLLFIAAALAALTSPAWAVNKCTGLDGKVAYQETPCGNASKATEQVKTWDSKLSGGSGEVGPLKLKGPAQAKPLLELYRRWTDAEQLALSTSRIALSGPIATLQAIQREAEGMSSPACLDESRKILVELTQKSSQGLLNFLGKQALDGMEYTMIYRRELVPKFESAIKKAKCE